MSENALDIELDCYYPKISIGIPTYNSNGNIVETLFSVLGQHYPNLEIIISDNFSNDNTQELCTEVAKSFPSVQYFRQKKNIGLIANFEFVLKQATGDFFMWIADDDTLEAGILKKYADFLESHPDYSLVSGQILYWLDGHASFCEKDFTMGQKSGGVRVIQYYFKVVYGGMFHGLMRRKFAEKAPLRNRMGDDWHFVATLAYLGKIKNLECVGYNKKFGGSSKSFKQYAKIIGAEWFSANFPFVKIAIDAFNEILFLSPVYGTMPVYSRLILALSSSTAILIRYYCKLFPFVIGGRIKRFLKLESLLHFGYRKLKSQKVLH